VFLVFVGFLALRLRYQRLYTPRRRGERAGGGGVFQDPNPNDGLAARRLRPATVTPSGTGRTSPWGRHRAILLKRALILAALVAVMFLPYRYDPGGSVEVLPLRKNSIYMQQAGVIEEVFFDGGELLRKGTVIAQLANFKQRRDVDVTLAQIKMKQEALNVLMTTPSSEQIDLAQNKLDTAKVELEYSQKRLQRIEPLHQNGTVSDAILEDASKELDIARQKVMEQQENLRVVRTQVNPHQVESVKAEIELLERELVYYRELLSRTELKVPFDGRLITMHLKDLQNKYLDENDLFAEAEDTSRVYVEIDIPESDIGIVAIGDAVRLKLELAPGETVVGEISGIYPTSKESDYGKVVTVLALVDNKDQRLRSGMTGFAKIEGEEMFFVEAFSRALLRFVQIEMWSWIP
jgi:putative peptide zinc metalloprotease protein